jgi:GAF domain-containing protein
MIPSYVAGNPFVVGGYRAVLAVPMLKDNELIGSINIQRQEAGSFSNKHIELVTNFAAQAVIAIENARLLSELRQRTNDLGEALEQQTATSKVLQVISSSPGELEPVFQTMLENATRICEAKFGALFLYEGGTLKVPAQVGVPPDLAEHFRSREGLPPIPGTAIDQVIRTKQVVSSENVAAEPSLSPAAQLAGARSYVAVPMLKENQIIGIISIYRQEVRPFTDRQIELVTNFAAQAVIAIENVRLLNELRESLFHPGRLPDRAALRRHRAWPRHYPQASAHDGRRRHRGERAG